MSEAPEYWFCLKHHQVEGRDGCRTPVPWDGTPPGHGFTTGTPWLPLGPQAATRNVEDQSVDPGSVLSLYRTALRVRRDGAEQTLHVRVAAMPDRDGQEGKKPAQG